MNEAKRHQEQFLAAEKARANRKIYTIEGIPFDVDPGVFPPATDTKLLASHIRTNANHRILDLTTGSGVIAVLAGLQGASGYAVDINSQAVQNAQRNLRNAGVSQIHAVQSDLFSRIPKGLYTQMYVNGPFFEGEISDPLDYACYGAESFYPRLFSQAGDYLYPEGKIMMVLSEFADTDSIEGMMDAASFDFAVIAKRASDDGKRIYRLYDITAR